MQTISRLIRSDVLDALRAMPSESVHMICSSPPYFALREYDTGDYKANEIGLEPTIGAWLKTIVAVGKELKRVLRKDGIMFLNFGDSYNSDRSKGSFGDQSKHGYTEHGEKRQTEKGLSKKCRLAQPERALIALIDDGWIYRDQLIWYKRNAMPSSVEDRSTPAHEPIWALSRDADTFYDDIYHRAIQVYSKCERYFYDRIAVQEPSTSDHNSGNGFEREEQIARGGRGNSEEWQPSETRNLRSVIDIPTQGFPGAHFATWPVALADIFIKAGTSEKGCCPVCAKPIKRVVEKTLIQLDKGNRKRADAPGAEVSATSVFRTGEYYRYDTVGWKFACAHGPDDEDDEEAMAEAIKDAVPCVVLDPFNGSGSTGVSAARLSRNYIGIDLSVSYIEMARERISQEMQLFNTVTVEDHNEGSKKTRTKDSGKTVRNRGNKRVDQVSSVSQG